MKKGLSLFFAVFLLLLTACGAAPEAVAEEGYRLIPQEEAAAMMEEDGVLVLDVRREDEYAEGHIPGAVNLPNEDITVEEEPELLPDKEQTILVYCRSGRRSAEAAKKLAALGYTQVYDFGGVLSWTGELVTAEEEAQSWPNVVDFYFPANPTTGYSWAAVIDDPAVASLDEQYFPNSSDLGMTGVGGIQWYRIRGLSEGMTSIRFSYQRPWERETAPLYAFVYRLSVDAAGNVLIWGVEMSAG